MRPGRDGRLLLGFSKSGWGAFSLLLRHPDLIHKAVTWDAPLMMDHPGPYGSGPIFGTPENFASYRVSTLLEQQAPVLQGPPRLFHLGHGNFRDEHTAAEALLQRLAIPHRYVPGPRCVHRWDSGRMPEAAALLLEAQGSR